MTTFRPYTEKKRSRNVYVKTKKARKTLLLGLIAEIKAEIRAIKPSSDLSFVSDRIGKKEKLIVAYIQELPEVTSRSMIAKGVGADKMRSKGIAIRHRRRIKRSHIKSQPISCLWS